MLPKTTLWMLIIVIVLVLLFVLNTHVVKTNHGMSLVKKSRWAFTETLVDVHGYTQADLDKHPLLKKSLQDGNRQDILSEIIKPDTSTFGPLKGSLGSGYVDPNRYINRAKDVAGRVEQGYQNIGKVDQEQQAAPPAQGP
jgi:hypothetical protein